MPKNENPLLFSHAANPLPVHIKDDIYRIFYSGRSIGNKSSVGYVDIDILKCKIIDYPKRAVYKYGNDSTFFSNGISIGNTYKIKSETYMLFMGWRFAPGEHWRGEIGRFYLVNNNQLQLDPSRAFITLDEEDPISLSYPFVIVDGPVYKMWYGSTLTWNAGNGEMTHVIKYATSTDGYNWKKHGVAVPYEVGIAQAFSKPTVLIDNEGYHMWYSFRSGSGKTYRIGYAHSNDGINWERMENEAGIDVSDKGWDSEMICYPFVFKHKGRAFMLYNGNGYGKTGFGMAIYE